jgi:basic amino acid/polyamine antiporter, APA family
MLEKSTATQLRRTIGLVEATGIGIGAMVGAGVYMSLGEAAGATGESLLLAVLLGAAIATMNGLSSVELGC